EITQHIFCPLIIGHAFWREFVAVLNRLEQRKPVGLRYDPQAQSLVCLPTQTRTGWNLNGFEVGFRPCVRLMIYGRSLEAQ
ncbi:hypothetical protein O5542_30130, partial [Escherichia coli]|nr:hypothetical protein [Escherichia coli]